jgi:thiol-disulfide isomerase/thioredoxin
MPVDGQKQGSRNKMVTALAAAGVAALAGFAAVYVTLGRPDNAVRPVAQAPAQVAEPPKDSVAPQGPGANPLSRGHMAAFVFRKQPEALPEIKFQDAKGAERSLADWKGRIVLLNLWATWCVPCRKEMPALDRLQAELGGDKFEVVAISVDRKGLEASKKFLDETGAQRLALYADPTARLASTLRAVGLPATLLLDGEGREIGRLLGPAEWDSDDAKRLIASILK